MPTVSDALVERVARAVFESRHTTVWDNETNSLQESYRIDARAAIAALSTPEFVLPLAEAMLRGTDTGFWEDGVCEFSGYPVKPGSLAECYARYRAAKGERC
jgi:hypothetical protein